MALIELILFTAVVGLLVYKFATKNYHTFTERGLPHEKPLPFLGNNGSVMFGKSSFLKMTIDYYMRNKHHKVVGFYQFTTPMIMVNDPESIKKITVKDFEYFPNHQPFFVSDEPLVNDMLSVMKDQRWKNMRHTLSPAYTSAKMRQMFELMNDSFAECLKYLSEYSTNGKAFDIEMKALCTRLSNDLIASTAFGLKTNSFENPKNDFYDIGQAVAFFRGKQMLKLLISTVSPKIFKLLGTSIFDREKVNYFIRLVVDTMKRRSEQNIVRPDMIQLLLEAKKDSNNDWNDEELIAQCFIFFFAAFENNANLICTTSLELALNPDVQQNLYEECKDVQDTLQGAPLTYDVVNKMKYMDQVVSESLRKWPLAPSTDRLCSKDYTLTDEEGNKIFDFKVNDRLIIPIGGFHHDPKYFENPMQFDPERFSDENKESISQYIYLPFGIGPRSCIGNRYALMQAKAMLYQLLLNYKFEPCTKTVKDLMVGSTGFQLTPKDGFWLRLVPRK